MPTFELAAAAGASVPGWVPVLAGVIVAVLGTGGLAALLRSRPEGTKILVDAAQGVVVVQTSLIQRMEADLAEARSQIAELRTHMVEVTELRQENERLLEAQRLLERENQKLRRRVGLLEAAARDTPAGL